MILDEISMHADDPTEQAAEAVAAAIFGTSGLGRTVIGSPSSVATLSRRLASCSHWKRHYRPGCLVVAAAGKVDHDRLVRASWALLDVSPSTSCCAAGSSPTMISQSAAGWSCASCRSSNAARCWRSPVLASSTHVAMHSACSSLIVGGGMASRLFVEMRERRGLSYSIDAGETAYSDAGLWSVEWQCAPGKLAADPEAGACQRSPRSLPMALPRKSWRGPRARCAARPRLSFDGPGSRMSRLGINAVLGDERTLDRAAARSFDQVSADQVRAEAEAPVQTFLRRSPSPEPAWRLERVESLALPVVVRTSQSDEVGRWSG